MIEYALIASLAGFCLINLALGFYQGKDIRKVSTYIFGTRYSTGVLLLTLTGTFIGADYLSNWFKVGSHWGGAGACLWIISISITAFLATFYIFPKLRTFKKWYTLGDIARQAYGSRHAQIAVDSTSLVSSVILLSAQLVALKRVVQLLKISKDNTPALYFLVIVFTLVVIAYASRAGTPGIVATDVLQMGIILGGTAFLAFKLLYLKLDDIHIQGIGDLWHQVKVQSGKNPFRAFFDQHTVLKRALLSSSCSGLLLFSPAFIKRVGMASDNRQLKRSMLGFVIIFSLFIMMIVTTGFGLFIVHKGVVGYDHVYPTLLRVISDSLWTKLLLLIMFMSAVMSTADSILNAASLCATRVIMNLQHEEGEPSIRKLRLANVVVGLLALMFALFFINKSVIDFVVFARSILGALIPCMVGISLGIKKSKKALLGSMACFVVFFLGSMVLVQLVDLSFLGQKMINPKIPLRFKYRPLLPFVILLSVLVYVIFETIVHKGLKWEPRERFTKENSNLLSLLGNRSVSLWRNPIVWAEGKLERYESRGVLLMLLCVVTSLTSMLSTEPFNEVYLKPMTLLMLLVFLLCTFNLFPEQWYPKIRIYYPLYWMVSLFICIPFASLLRWLYHPTFFNALYLVFVPIMMHGFIGRRLGVAISLLGYLIGVGVYRLTADANLSFGGSHSIVPLALLSFSTLLSWALLGYHTERSLAKAQRPKMWAASWGHDFNHLFMEAQFTTMLEYNPLPKEKEARLKEAESRLHTLAGYLQHAIEQSKAFRQLIIRDSIRASEVETLSLSDVLDYVYKTLTREFQEMTNITGKALIKVKVFKPIFANVIANLLRNAWKAGATKVELTWDEKAPILYIKDNGPGIAKEKQATLFEWEAKRDGTGIGLPFIKEVLAKMGALIDLQSSDQGAIFMILFEQESN